MLLRPDLSPGVLAGLPAELPDPDGGEAGDRV